MNNNREQQRNVLNIQNVPLRGNDRRYCHESRFIVNQAALLEKQFMWRNRTPTEDPPTRLNGVCTENGSLYFQPIQNGSSSIFNHLNVSLGCSLYLLKSGFHSLVPIDGPRFVFAESCETGARPDGPAVKASFLHHGDVCTHAFCFYYFQNKTAHFQPPTQDSCNYLFMNKQSILDMCQLVRLQVQSGIHRENNPKLRFSKWQKIFFCTTKLLTLNQNVQCKLNIFIQSTKIYKIKYEKNKDRSLKSVQFILWRI